MGNCCSNQDTRPNSDTDKGEIKPEVSQTMEKSAIKIQAQFRGMKARANVDIQKK